MDSATALAELKSAQGSRKSANDYYTQYSDELGAGTAKGEQENLRKVIRDTQTQLKGVGESVAGRTRGNLVTEAQRARLQALESQPIAERLGEFQTQYGDVSQNYRDILSQVGQRSGMAYQSDADRISGLQKQYENIFGREQSDAEQRRWQQQFEEQRRQAEAQLAEMQRSRLAQERKVASMPSLQSILDSINNINNRNANPVSFTYEGAENYGPGFSVLKDKNYGNIVVPNF